MNVKNIRKPAEITVMVLIILAVAMIPCVAFADPAPQDGEIRNYTETYGIMDEGKCGDNVTYKISGTIRQYEQYDSVNGWVPVKDLRDGILVISGTGSTYDIKNKALFSLDGVEEIIVESGVTAIGSHLFDWYVVGGGCVSKVTLPDGLKSIGDYAFYWRGDVKSMKIPDTVTYIGPYAFYVCCESSPDGLNVPDGLKTIEKYSFHNAGFKTLKIPDSVTTIKEGGFSDSHNLENIIWGKGLRIIGPYAFCGSTFKELSVPDYVTSVDEYAFHSCKNLKKAKVSKSLKKMSTGMFFRCTKLEQVTIPSSSKITVIGERAFLRCSSLKSITLPKGVTKIEYEAFAECPKLKTMTLQSKKAPKLENWVFGKNKKEYAAQTEKMTIKCPNMSKKEKKEFKAYLKKKGYYGKVN